MSVNFKKRRIFFADERSKITKSTQGRLLKIKGDDYLHMRKVLRLEEGAKVEIFFKDQQRYNATLLQYEKDGAVLLLREPLCSKNSLPNTFFRLFLAIPRPSVLAAVTHKLVELGVAELCPVLTQRSILSKPSEFNLLRYEKIAKEAMKQSRSFLPLSICSPVSLADLPAVMKKNAQKDTMPSLNVLCDEVLAGESAYVLDEQTKLATKTFNIFVGSEGGITRKEVALLQDLGFQTIALHRFILRVETAVVFVLARLM